MIVTHVRHGRTVRDAKSLSDHLLSCRKNAAVEVVSIVGLAAATLENALAGMRRLASRKGVASFHHISLSPTQTCTPGELRADADRVLREMGADPQTHPHVFVVHHLESPAGRGDCHGHLIVAHWGPDGRALDDAWLFLRFERVAREIEHDRGHPLTRGRHDASLITALRARGRADVADALQALRTTASPRSSVTSAARARLKRQGVSDVAARVAVKAAWAASDTPAAFRAALVLDKLRVVPGKKADTFIVETVEGIEVGALDRILKVKCAEVVARMENTHGHHSTVVPGGTADVPVPGDPAAHAGDRREDGPADAASGTAGGVRRAIAFGDFADDAGRHPCGVAEGDDRPGGSRNAGQVAVGYDAAQLAPRIFDQLTAQVIRRDLKPDTLHTEAVEHACRLRHAELRVEFEAARGERDQRHEPVSPSEELASARERAEQAQQRAEGQRRILRLAEADHAAMLRAAPQGWRRWVERLKGGLATFEADHARTSAALRTAEEYRRARDYIADGAVTKLRRVERAEQVRQAEVEGSQRLARAAAALRMERALIAATLLRRTAEAAFLSLPTLFARAEQERLRMLRETVEPDGPTPIVPRP